MIKFYRSTVFILLVGACAHQKPEPTETKAVAPPATETKEVPERKNTVIAVSLNAAQKKSFRTEFTRKNCSFGKLASNRPAEVPKANFSPAVLCKAHGRSFFASFEKNWQNYEWIDVTVLPNKKNSLVGVMDYGVEGGLETVPVFKTENGGHSWLHTGDIHKPHFSARLTKVIFDSPAAGKILMETDDGAKEIFAVETKDAGRTWSAPYTIHAP